MQTIRISLLTVLACGLGLFCTCTAPMYAQTSHIHEEKVDISQAHNRKQLAPKKVSTSTKQRVIYSGFEIEGASNGSKVWDKSQSRNREHNYYPTIFRGLYTKRYHFGEHFHFQTGIGLVYQEYNYPVCNYWPFGNSDVCVRDSVSLFSVAWPLTFNLRTELQKNFFFTVQAGYELLLFSQGTIERKYLDDPNDYESQYGFKKKRLDTNPFYAYPIVYFGLEWQRAKSGTFYFRAGFSIPDRPIATQKLFKIPKASPNGSMAYWNDGYSHAPKKLSLQLGYLFRIQEIR